jgi:hypothetical protein
MSPHDHAAHASPHGEPAAADPSALTRSGSQKRQRHRCVAVWLTEAEHAEAEGRARSAGLSLSSYGRAALLGDAGPRARRTPPVHAQLLGHAIAALNRAGNVANQIAHRLNAAQSLGGREAVAALQEIRDAARAIRDAVGRKDRANDNQGQQAQ